MRNAILHASAHANTRINTRENQWQAWAKAKTETRDIRIRTLLKHNPFDNKENQEETQSPEKSIGKLTIQLQQQIQTDKEKRPNKHQQK